jgi:Ca-activated chloride channel family protein
MGDPVPGSGGKSKLALAKQGAISSLSEFRDDDEVGAWSFSTQLGPPEHPIYNVLAPIGPIGSDRSALESQISGLATKLGTPLYDVAKASYDEIEQGYDPSRINAVVLLSDGDDRDSKMQLPELVDYLKGKSESSTGPAVRIFTIAYGKDADVNAMREIAKATNGAYYDATDPSTIVDVLNAVVSNF